MPVELAFEKTIAVGDAERYFNDCCIDGDIVCEQLLPDIRTHYSDVMSAQEDWGWFIWCKAGDTRLSIDVFCDDSNRGAFRLRLATQSKRRFFGYRYRDTPELEALVSRVRSRLEGWLGTNVSLSQMSEKDI